MAVPPFVGRGLGFPLRTDATGSIALVDAAVELQEAIGVIVATVPGERPMRPEFGCRLHLHAFSPIDRTTVSTIAFEVERAVTRWEPRVEVDRVDVYADDDVEGLLYVALTYRVRASNDERNLVFPFYTIPDDEGP